MKLFKNKVGRPSKEFLRRKRMFYVSCLSLILVLITSLFYVLFKGEKVGTLSTIRIDKLKGQVLNVDPNLPTVSYIDNVILNTAKKDSLIIINEKFKYSGTSTYYYRLDLLKGNDTVKKGTCRVVNTKKIATMSFKLSSSNLSVVTGIYDDANCQNNKVRYRTKDYIIRNSAVKTTTTTTQSAKISMPKFQNFDVGQSSGKFTVSATSQVNSVVVESSNPEIIEVVKHGDNSINKNSWELKAKKAGEVNIVAKALDENGKVIIQTGYAYKVTEKKSITMSKVTSNFKVGSYTNISVVPTPLTDSVTVTSSNPSVIEVTKNSNNSYKLTAKSAGKATITAKSSSGKTQSYTYTVEDKLTVSVSSKFTNMDVGSTTGDFVVSVSSASNVASVTVISHNTSIVQILKLGNNNINGNKWRLKAKAAGAAQITAQAKDKDGKVIAQTSYTCTVSNPVAKTISMTKLDDVLSTGEEYDVNVNVSPTSDTVTLTSSNSSVIEVVKNSNTSYKLKTKSTGKATITVKSSSGKTQSYTYSVENKLSVSVSARFESLEVGNTTGDFVVSVSSTSNVASVTVISNNVNVVQILKLGNNNINGNKWRLKAKAVGSANITAQAKDKNGKVIAQTVYTCKVINKPEEKSISMTNLSQTLEEGQSGNITVTVKPTTDTVTVSSSNTSVITVTKNSNTSYKLTAKAAGKATITATSSSGKTQSYTYTVNAKKQNILETNGSSFTNKKWKVGEQEYLIIESVYPQNATITVTSSNTNVITVKTVVANSSYEIMPVGGGDATITVSASNGLKKEYKYSVTQNVSVTLPNYGTMQEGGEYGKFKVSATPASMVSKVTVESSNSSIVQVVKYGDNSLNGNSWGLKAKAAGTVTITAKALDSSGKELAKASQSYTVKKASNKISMSKYSFSEWTSQKYGSFTVTVEPSSATYTVTSSNPYIMRVTPEGGNSYKLEALLPGTATITAKSSLGATDSVTYKVKEYGKPSVNTFIKKGYTTYTTGGVTAYIENGCNASAISKYKKDLDKVPDYAKKGGKIAFFATDASLNYNSKKDSYGAYTTGYLTNLYMVYRCDFYNDAGTIWHEYGHVVDAFYGALMGVGNISNTKTYVDAKNQATAYNKTVSDSSKKILRDYSFSNQLEFFADAYSSYLHKFVFKTGLEPYGKTWISGKADVEKQFNTTIPQMQNIYNKIKNINW